MPDGSLVLDLAESITQLDPLTYEIKIKQGVTFHNGDPMTVDDVVSSITRLAIGGGMEGKASPRKSITIPTLKSWWSFYFACPDIFIRIILSC